jgi:dUTP pyrophosphatase
MIINVMLSPDAVMPVAASNGAAGFDLFAAEDTTINCFQFKPVSTGVSIEIPAGHYGRVAPRSGLSVKHGVMVGAGVIDSDYRGEVKVALATLNGVYDIKKGDRIAQLIIERIATPELVQVDSLDSTDRGEGGFGSTGK